MSLPDHLLATQLFVAKTYIGIGVKEEPLGSNLGYWVEEFQKDAGCNEGDAWCMAFIYSCHLEACRMQRVKKPFLKRTGWCKGQWIYAMDYAPRLKVITARDMIAGAKAPDGSVWIRFDDTGRGHTGFVYDHDPKTNTLKSIEGNATDRVKPVEYIITNIANFKGVIL